MLFFQSELKSQNTAGKAGLFWGKQPQEYFTIFALQYFENYLPHYGLAADPWKQILFWT